MLLAGIAAVLVLGRDIGAGAPLLAGASQAVAGVAAGFGIGVVASLLGVAGGELLIPTLVLLFGADLKLAGILSLAVSLPTPGSTGRRDGWMEGGRDGGSAAVGSSPAG